MNTCDNCGSPMIAHTHHRAEVCPLGDTDQCLLCGSCEDAAELLEECDALLLAQKTAESLEQEGDIYEQICKLTDRIILLDAREARRQDQRDFPREVAADRRRGLT